MSESCCVVEDDCECPANLEQKEINEINLRTKCFACGLIVCKKCSKIMNWYLFGKRRICLNCISMTLTQKPIPAKKKLKHTTDEFTGNVKVTISKNEVRVWVCDKKGCQFRFKAMGKVIKSGGMDVMIIAENKS